MTLAGKVAVVTGAGSGIGRAMVERFVSDNAMVVAVDISGNQDAVARGMGDRCLGVHGDVTDADDFRRVIATTVSHFGRLDIVCNNAGISGDIGPLADMTEENFTRVIDADLRSVFLGTKLSLPVLVAGGGGSIVNTASVAGLVAVPMFSIYGAAKAAVIQLTRAAAVEYGPQGVRVNAICPGTVDTPGLRRLPQEAVERLVAQHPLGRLALPAEVAAVAVFLAGDEASFVTGCAITIDGGFTSH